jgi:large subunit ribosomal protein L19
MNRDILNKIESSFTEKKLPDVKPGQTVEIDTIIRDKDKQRIQVFKGLVIGVKGSGTSKTFTVRKISYGVGVEKTFPLYSTNISAIRIVKYEPVRRSKLYFMRDRIGKSALRIKKGRAILVSPEEGVAEEPVVEETIETPEVTQE